MRGNGDLSQFVKAAARNAGFDLAGIAAVSDFPELARFPEWIAEGRAGEMKYLESRDESGQLRRAQSLLDPRPLLARRG